MTMVRRLWSIFGLALIALLVTQSLPVTEPPPRPVITASPESVPVVPPPTPSPMEPAQPMRLRIPAIDVDAPIMRVGMTDAVTMEVPHNIRTVGWFGDSRYPGENQGTVVLVGHRDGRNDPNGVFRELGSVDTGASLVLWDAHGSPWRYEVDTVELISRSEFAERAAEFFSLDGAERLVLLTCGGTYDRARGGYQANVVVTARQA